jgi:hypothetical protein
MCIKQPKIEKAPPPPKRNTETPDLDVANAAEEDLLRMNTAMGIDQLRIERTSPAAALPAGQAGLQIRR